MKCNQDKLEIISPDWILLDFRSLTVYLFVKKMKDLMSMFDTVPSKKTLKAELQLEILYFLVF